MIDCMDDAQRIIPVRRPPRFQFNLKFVLAVTTLCALAATAAVSETPPSVYFRAAAVLVVGSCLINVLFWGWPRAPRRELAPVVWKTVDALLVTLMTAIAGLVAGAIALFGGFILIMVGSAVVRRLGQSGGWMDGAIITVPFWIGWFAASIAANAVINSLRTVYVYGVDRGRSEKLHSDEPTP